MLITEGLYLPDSLLDELAQAGQQGHQTALDHDLSLGSSGFTFGSDRFHRSCELAKPVLRSHGFKVRNVGAGLRATKDGLELRFATARGPASAEVGSVDLRRPANVKAAIQNLTQPALEFLDGWRPQPTTILHVVWSGTRALGLSAVHVGKVIGPSKGQVRWEFVRRVDQGAVDVPVPGAISLGTPLPYDMQPEPDLQLGYKDPAEYKDEDVDDSGEASSGGS